MIDSQANLFSNTIDSSTGCEWGSPAAEWAEESAKHALDDLFNATFAYRTSEEYYDLLKFIRKFRFYSPFNAMLIHIQRPGAKFVAPAIRWVEKYGYKIKINANPLVILQPMGPVMFVFDVADVKPGPDAQPLPPGVEKPFEVSGGKIGKELERTNENAKRDGIRIHAHKSGSQGAGAIGEMVNTNLPPLHFQVGTDKYRQPIYEQIPARYEMLFSEDLSREARYATIVHELAHLYCGHLGTPNKKWWPDRIGLSPKASEFEAESVAYLVCTRLDIDIPAAAYLSGYVKNHEEVPKISLECVMKAAWLIERMGKKRLKKRKGEPYLGTEVQYSPLLFPEDAPKEDPNKKTEETTIGVGSSDPKEFDVQSEHVSSEEGDIKPGEGRPGAKGEIAGERGGVQEGAEGTAPGGVSGVDSVVADLLKLSEKLAGEAKAREDKAAAQKLYDEGAAEVAAGIKAFNDILGEEGAIGDQEGALALIETLKP